MHDSIREARRVANNLTRQRADTATRRAALAALRPLDVVQVVDSEADRTLPPIPLWQVLATEDGARVYLLSDWRRGPDGLVCMERYFNADGLELDGQRQVVPKGRVLVAPVLPTGEVARLQHALLERWERATSERAAELRMQWLASVSSGLRALITGEGTAREEEDMALAEPTAFDGTTVSSLREAVAGVFHQRVRDAFGAELPAAEVEAAIAAAVRVEDALRDVPTTDREVAWMLAHLPPDVVRRALRMADALRERYVGGERLLPLPEGA